MKHGKKPTVAQRNWISRQDLDWKDYLVVKDTPKEMRLIHRRDKTQKTLPKAGR